MLIFSYNDEKRSCSLKVLSISTHTNAGQNQGRFSTQATTQALSAGSVLSGNQSPGGTTPFNAEQRSLTQSGEWFVLLPYVKLKGINNDEGHNFTEELNPALNKHDNDEDDKSMKEIFLRFLYTPPLTVKLNAQTNTPETLCMCSYNKRTKLSLEESWIQQNLLLGTSSKKTCGFENRSRVCSDRSLTAEKNDAECK